MVGLTKDKLQEKLKNIYWKYDKSSTLVSDMGSGKTLMGIKIVNEIKEKSNILVISPKKNISGKVKGGNIWEKELKLWPSHHNWDFTTIQAATRWHVEAFIKYDLVIIDEIHECLTDKRIQVIKYLNTWEIQILGLTGTPDLNNEFKKEAYEKYCPIIYTYLNAAEDGLINKTKILIYNHYLDNNTKYLTSTKNTAWRKGELDTYDYFTDIIEKTTFEIRNTYYSLVQKMANLYIDSHPHYSETISYLIEEDLDTFRERYWKIIKEKKLPYDLYKIFRKIQGDDYAKLGMKAAHYAKMAPEKLKKYFYRYIWARDSRKNMLLRLDSTAKIAKSIKNNIISKGKKVLIFSEENDQVSKITNCTYFSKNSKVNNHINITNFRRGNSLELGTSKALSLGENLPGVAYAILESFQGSETRNNQSKGRLARLNVNKEAVFIVIRVMNTQSEIWFDKFKEGLNAEIKEYNNLNKLLLKLNL